MPMCQFGPVSSDIGLKFSYRRDVKSASGVTEWGLDVNMLSFGLCRESKE